MLVQQRHRIARRNRDAAVVGMAFTAIMAGPTHGTSLFGLLFTVPRYVHYSRKLGQYRDELRELGIQPLPRTKRDFAIPLIMGTGSAALGTVLGDVGALTIMGAPLEGFVNHVIGPHSVGELTRIFGGTPAEQLAQTGLGLVVDRLISPLNRIKKRSDTLDSMASTSSVVEPALYDGVKDMLIQWGLMGCEKTVYANEEEFLAAVGRTEEEMQEALDNIDELVHLVMESIFSDEELEIINKYLTEHAIFEVMRTVLSSAEYQGLNGEDDEPALKMYFKHLVLSATKEIRRKKQVVQSIGEKIGSTTPVCSSGSQRSKMALHYGIPCNSCEDLEIEGVRYNCTGCSGDVNYCYDCFMKAENEEHIFQHKWIAFHLSSYDLTPPSERIPLTPLDDTLCSVCEHPIDEGRFNCRDCETFDVCKECFEQGGKTLHETHTFGLISPFGWQVVDRDTYFGHIPEPVCEPILELAYPEIVFEPVPEIVL